LECPEALLDHGSHRRGLIGWYRGEILGDLSGEKATTGEYVGFSLGLGIILFSGFEAARSRNALDDAIWQFNRAPVP